MIRRFASGRQCTLSQHDQAWIEERWKWLSEQFGEDYPRKRPVILPTPEFFPNTSTTTQEGIDALFLSVCQYMAVDSATVTLDIFDPAPTAMHGKAGAAGYYRELSEGRFCIHIAKTMLEDPMQFVATAAHELAHVHLLGHKKLTQDTPDHEYVTDLLPIFFGIGIFGANATIFDKSRSDGNSTMWVVGKLGYMSMAMHSYALAKLAYTRGEVAPTWVRSLRPDVRADFREFTRVLSGKSTIKEDPIEQEDDREPIAATPVQEEPHEDSDVGQDAIEAAELLDHYASGERDFRRRYLARLQLAHVNLSGCDFTDSNFNGADLQGANLADCDFTGSSFRSTNLVNTSLARSVLKEADFTAADLTGANLSQCDLRDCSFRNATLVGTNITGTQRSIDTDFRFANLSNLIADHDISTEIKASIRHFESGGVVSETFFWILTSIYALLFSVFLLIPISNAELGTYVTSVLWFVSFALFIYVRYKFHTRSSIDQPGRN